MDAPNSMHISVAARSNVRMDWDHSNTGIVGSNPVRRMKVCLTPALCYPVQVERPRDGLIPLSTESYEIFVKDSYVQKLILNRDRPEGLINIKQTSNKIATNKFKYIIPQYDSLN
jgi:hypothetical protein